MKRSTCFILSAALWVMVGCQAAPKPLPGMAGLRIKVEAEPKAGAPTPESSDYSSTSSVGTGAFETVDYAGLADIVVWAEPAAGKSASGAAPALVDFDAAHPSATARAVSVGQQLLIRNRGARGVSVYSVSDGNEFDVGSLHPGVQAEYTVRSPGVIEVLVSSSAEPVAVLYAVPSRWVSVAKSGASVDFNDLPTGPCKVSAWHARLPGSSAEVNLAVDQFAQTTLRVGVNGLPKVGPTRKEKAH